MPFVENYLPALMAQAHALMAHEFHEIVRGRGFTVSEWRVLASLADRGPVPIGRLAQFVVMKQPTVTRVLVRQEARGEVERIAHKTDRRITLVSITPLGTRLVAEQCGLSYEEACYELHKTRAEFSHRKILPGMEKRSSVSRTIERLKGRKVSTHRSAF